MTTSELYRAIRDQMLELGANLSPEQSDQPVPALPGWSVKDTYAHLTGLCGDILDGRMEGAGSPAWTATHVAERSNDDLPAICAEWARTGPRLDTWLQEQGDHGATFVAFDVWTHHQDVRSALDLNGERGAEQVDYLLARALNTFNDRFREAEAPALRVITDRVDRNLGRGPPDAALRTTDYELLRILFGRRSAAQMTNGHWEGDPTPYLDHLHLFEPPAADLVD
jgi:uncharacterized protein (TIGR03083 family)